MGILINEIPGVIWTANYIRRFALFKYSKRSFRLSYRTSLIKLSNGKLVVTSPGGPLGPDLTDEIRSLNCPVSYIVAPGTYKHYRLDEWQKVFPEVKTIVCPGAERIYPTATFDGILNEDDLTLGWKRDLDLIYFSGTRAQEYAFFHRVSRTLIVGDIVQNLTPAYFVETEIMTHPLKMYLTLTSSMGKPAMSPLFRMGIGKIFTDLNKTKEKMTHILETLQPEGLIVSQGENVWGKDNVREALQKSWEPVLNSSS